MRCRFRIVYDYTYKEWDLAEVKGIFNKEYKYVTSFKADTREEAIEIGKKIMKERRETFVC